VRFYVNVALLVVLSLLLVPSALAQISLDDLPDAQGNNRFFSDEISQVTHPSLTLNGFDDSPVLRDLLAPAPAR
jgi:hypothetical protein